MDQKTLDKSCKYCVALVIGILVGVVFTKMIDKSSIYNKENSSCDCKNQ